MAPRRQAQATVPPLVQPEKLRISEEEQWRIVNESGILHKIPAPSAMITEVEDETPLADEIFNAVVYIIPFSFLLFMMDILVHRQYGRTATYKDIADRLGPGIPILSIFIFYTVRYKQDRRMQALLFLASVALGTRMIWLVNIASWRLVMKQCPPIATAWVYAIVQLNLGPATASLLVVWAWVWWAGMKLVL